jgi:hypothetical protein
MTEGEKDRVALSYKSAYSPFWRGYAKNRFVRVNLDSKSAKIESDTFGSDNYHYRSLKTRSKIGSKLI